jgi:hypothetical protein
MRKLLSLLIILAGIHVGILFYMIWSFYAF